MTRAWERAGGYSSCRMRVCVQKMRCVEQFAIQRKMQLATFWGLKNLQNRVGSGSGWKDIKVNWNEILARMERVRIQDCPHFMFVAFASSFGRPKSSTRKSLLRQSQRRDTFFLKNFCHCHWGYPSGWSSSTWLHEKILNEIIQNALIQNSRNPELIL